MAFSLTLTSGHLSLIIILSPQMYAETLTSQCITGMPRNFKHRVFPSLVEYSASEIAQVNERCDFFKTPYIVGHLTRRMSFFVL